MQNKKIALAVAALSLGLSGMVQAELSANIGVSSNYVWRGVSQTDDGAAVSGGIDYAQDSGFYAGTWVSNVDFNDASGGQTEWDLYAGFAGEAGDMGYDLGVIYYAYPTADDAADELDFTEIYASLAYNAFTLGANYTVDKEDSSAEENDLYLYVSAGTDLSDGWSVGGTIGHYDYDAGNSYQHAQLDIGKNVGEFGDFTLSLSKLDNDGTGNEEDALVFVSWGKSF
jgi:uncharacterized protein (TIGR02001 family)